jgi:hypothetical protein
LDEVVAVHPILHEDVLKLLQDLFEVELEDLEILVQVSYANDFQPFLKRSSKQHCLAHRIV